MGDHMGEQLGNYRLLRLLGQGGFAQVYLGEHMYLQNRAAVKVLHARLSEEEAARFVTEARTLARLAHPHIVRVLDFAVHEGTPFLVMEYAPGGTLRTRHPTGTRLPLETIVSYVSQVASALQYAHEQRLIHRDVKPENLLLGAREQVLLGDFSLALLTPATPAGSTQALDAALAGTAPYLAPEQVQGHPRSASDQYALGVVVYEWLCGQRPFGGTPLEVALQQVQASPPPLREQLPELSPAVEEVVLRALAKEPGQRFASVQDFAIALQQAAQPAGDTFVTSVMPSASVAEGARPALAASGSPADLDQQQAQAQTVTTPGAAATPPGEREQQETPGDRKALEPLWKVPTSLTPLVGRAQDVAAICALLARPAVRLLTLLGVGGIGKTRLVIQVATQMEERFADGVCFVALAPISDPNLVLPTIAQELGMREGGAQSLVEHVKAFLREKHLLLLLDNFEQVVTAAPLVENLLLVCPHLGVLVTSREVLHLQAEHLFPVPPLALPNLAQLPKDEELAQYAAVSLFLQRAQALLPGFQLTSANARTIAELCVRLDGLPLAIELAAARIKLLPPRALLTRLEHRLQVLTSGARNMPARQQTLRNTIAWSYNLLDEQEQRLFRRLSIFVGGCTLSAIEASCRALDDGEAAIQVLDGVASLIDKSLLQQTEQDGEEPRLVMLETIREFGLECLQVSGELEAARRTHARYYLDLAEQAGLELRGPKQAAWLQRLEQEHNNLRAALEWALEEAEEQVAERRELALRLSAALKGLWMEHGHYREAHTFLERALARSEGEKTSLRARVLRTAANVAIMQGNHDRAEMLAQQSLVLCRELDDTRGIASSLFVLGNAGWPKGKTTERLSLFEERVRLARQLGKPGDVANALYHLAFELTMHGEYAQGQALFEEALGLFRKAGNELWVGAILVESAIMLWFMLGDAATMRQRLQEGQALIDKVGSRHWSAWSIGIAALVALREGETARAASLARESLAIFREIDSRWYIAWALYVLGRVEGQRGDLRAARSSYQESLAFVQKLGEEWITPFNLEGLASVAAAQGAFRWAAQLWGAAEALREVIAVPLMPADRADYEQAVRVARAQLGAPAFAAVWQEGRAMTPEQALAAQGAATSPPPTPAEALSTPPTKTSPTYPAGLTAREVEVLLLVAQGLTDAQVAEQLVISHRTVNWHLTSIYSKLQVTSRAAATRFAIEQHLV